MEIVLGVLLVLVFSLGAVLGLLSVLRDLMEKFCQGESADSEPPKSRFAWQSRSHFRAPD
jgi:hypothetical protein